MAFTNIDFKSFETTGSAIAEQRADGLHLSADRQNTRFYMSSKPLTSYITLPQRFFLPLKIDMTLRVNQPGFYLVLGEGHISFGTRMDNRSLGDIAEPDAARPKSFDNRLNLTGDIKISVLYGLKFMQIVIDGETRYFSKKEKYMRSPLFQDLNNGLAPANAGFELKLASDKFADVLIKKMTVEEYAGEPDAVPVCNEILPPRLSVSKGAKAGFEECISLLSPALQDGLIKTDRFLTAEKEFKIRRKIEGDQWGCKVTYTSGYGFSYSLLINETLMEHFFWWYMVSNYKFENKYLGRKNDLTNLTLEKAYAQAPEITGRLVSYYDKCQGCLAKCRATAVYRLNGGNFAACHGKMIMNMNPQTFADLRFMLNILKPLLKELII